jgi:signal peptidase I
MPRRLKRHLLPILLAAAAIAVLPGYVRAYKLTGASAAPTILMGDTVFVNRVAYDLRLPYSTRALVRLGSPRRGDLVQADLPEGIGLAFKRVIGLPGEAVEVRDSRVVIDGRELPVRPLDPAAFAFVPAAHHMGSAVVDEDGHWAASTPGSRYRNSAPVRLGRGEYFLMGDNRDDSRDSRAFGPVSREHILGKILAVRRTGTREAAGR